MPETPVTAVIDIAAANRELVAMDQLFCAKRISYCLCGGTLLACIRHQQLMPWDHDIDLMVHGVELDEVEDVIKGSGRFVRRLHVQSHDYGFTHFLQIYSGGVHIDVWPTRQDGDRFWTYAGPYDNEGVLPFRRWAMSGYPINVPRNPSIFLDRNYPGWRDEIVERLDGHLGLRTVKRQFAGKIIEPT